MGGRQTTGARARLFSGAFWDGNGAAAHKSLACRSLPQDLDCCRLHLAVRMLGWSDDWKPPAEHAHDTGLPQAKRISRRLQDLK